jgi:hypothetical protein
MATSEPISTNIELGLDIGPIHFHIHTELQASQSIHSKDLNQSIQKISINPFKRSRSDIVKLPSLHNFLKFDLCDLVE